MHHQIAGRLTSRVTKWIVLLAWVVILGISGGFAQKLTNVQDNEASSWLPGSAESTKALDELRPFQDPNDIPTVVVYHRAGGLSAQDLRTIRTQLPQIQSMDGVTGEVTGPVTSSDREVAQTLVTYNFGKNGWNDLPATADTSGTSPRSPESRSASRVRAVKRPTRPTPSPASTVPCSSPPSASS